MNELTEVETTTSCNQPTAGQTRHALRLSQMAIVRAPGLLPMWCTPAELGQELGVSARTIREWQRLGLPYRRDERGHLWIDGRQFASWGKTVSRPRARRR